MKPHPHIRKTIKWGGAALTVLLVVVWIGSGWAYVQWTDRQRCIVAVGGGQLTINYGTGIPLGSKGWDSGKWTYPFELWFFGLRGKRLIVAGVPLWAIVAPSLIMTATAWRLDTLARRRARMKLCPKCHYDRTGLAAGAVCPECGTSPQAT